jgi:hypothetical protein
MARRIRIRAGLPRPDHVTRPRASGAPLARARVDELSADALVGGALALMAILGPHARLSLEATLRRATEPGEWSRPRPLALVFRNARVRGRALRLLRVHDRRARADGVAAVIGRVPWAVAVAVAVAVGLDALVAIAPRPNGDPN